MHRFFLSDPDLGTRAGRPLNFAAAAENFR